MIEKNKKRNTKPRKEQPEFEQQIVDIARVTRVMAGGKRMSFRACVVIGDRKGRVGVGLAKGKDVAIAVGKAVKQAEKKLTTVNMRGKTIPHEVRVKLGAAKILLKPAPEGSGIISGGAVRTVLELAGIGDVVSKIMGTNNKVNNVKATIKGLESLKRVEKQKEIKEEKKEKIENKELNNKKSSNKEQETITK
ncbi:MAG TPA: 30S ribosomal protein S5 [Patescibacteria group bacterium]|nr:30S ribosomal protein S5 [Patescibacteria group bacterium]